MCVCMFEGVCIIKLKRKFYLIIYIKRQSAYKHLFHISLKISFYFNSLAFYIHTCVHIVRRKIYNFFFYSFMMMTTMTMVVLTVAIQSTNVNRLLIHFSSPFEFLCGNDKLNICVCTYVWKLLYWMQKLLHTNMFVCMSVCVFLFCFFIAFILKIYVFDNKLNCMYKFKVKYLSYRIAVIVLVVLTSTLIFKRTDFYLFAFNSTTTYIPLHQ